MKKLNFFVYLLPVVISLIFNYMTLAEETIKTHTSKNTDKMSLMKAIELWGDHIIDFLGDGKNKISHRKIFEGQFSRIDAKEYLILYDFVDDFSFQPMSVLVHIRK